ncbi:hypothetical protein BA20089_08650 [Bifidobacterium asteroides DSM 20089]|uniref:Uncharacterized protein n=1 Tax=Bifidobacterium asteroides DSM 20089 TaxID=1437594 RepID=A0AAD0AC96_9BIFI|nr:hypothetical protein BA20089_00050 [Bifidobacterium asteroides DSM 20089]ATO42161.1 hypothetical protein BA20089_08650 [Bifidobacterium asteroides DSM 20089]
MKHSISAQQTIWLTDYIRTITCFQAQSRREITASACSTNKHLRDCAYVSIKKIIHQPLPYSQYFLKCSGITICIAFYQTIIDGDTANATAINHLGAKRMGFRQIKITFREPTSVHPKQPRFY